MFSVLLFSLLISSLSVVCRFRLGGRFCIVVLLSWVCLGAFAELVVILLSDLSLSVLGVLLSLLVLGVVLQSCLSCGGRGGCAGPRVGVDGLSS